MPALLATAAPTIGVLIRFANSAATLPRVLAALREVRNGTDHRAVKAGIDALARATDEFAARRMDSSIRSALTGHKIDEISV